MKNVEGLKRYSQQRNEETVEKVNKAIANLKRSKKKITVAEVARKADVSVATIYNNPQLKERITQLKEVSNSKLPDEVKKALKGTRSPNNTKIDELKNKNKKLREEIENIKIDKGLLLGQLKDLASENLELRTVLEQYRNITSLKKDY